MSKRKILICLALLAIGIGAIYPTLSLLLFKIITNHYAAKYLGSSLSYESAYFDNGALVFLEPHDGDRGRFSAKQLTVQYSLHPLQRKIDLTVILEQPRWKIEEPLSTKKPKWMKRPSSNRWLQIRPSIKMHDGEMIFLGGSSESDFKAHFDLAYEPEKGGELHARFGSTQTEEENLLVKLSDEKEGIRISFACNQLKCRAFGGLIRFLYPGLSHWSVSSGVLNGNLEAFLSERDEPQMEGTLHLSEPILARKDIPVVLKGGMARLQLNKSKIASDPMVGELTFLDPMQMDYTASNGKGWHAHGILGSIHWDGVENVRIAIRGEGICNGCHSPFTLEGSTKLDPDHRIFLNLKTDFANNHLQIDGNIQSQGSNLILNGSAHVGEELSKNVDLIHFGCTFADGSPTNLSGWFHARELPLEKYISPILFRNNDLKLRGKGEFQGVFNESALEMHYKAENLIIENEDLLIENGLPPPNEREKMPGFYQLDFATFEDRGSLNFWNASYHEKNSGLNFVDIKGKAHFHDGVIHIDSMEAYCCDTYFSGALDIDYSDPAPKVFTIKLVSPFFSGRISRVQEMISHLAGQHFLEQIPLEGDISSRGQGLSFQIDFGPHTKSIQADFDGMMTHGSLPIAVADTVLDDINMDIRYSHQDRMLEFSDIHGTFLMGKPRNVQEFPFVGKYITINDVLKQDLRFDLGLYSFQNELVRLVGETADHEQDVKAILLDPTLSHVSSFRLDQFTCCVKAWSSLEKLNVKGTMPLQPMINDLSGFSQCGLFGIAPSCIDKMASFTDVEGSLIVDLNFDPIEKGVDLTLFSQDHPFEFNARYRGERWSIDALKYRSLRLFSELQHYPDRWRIYSLGASVGDAFLVGLEGDLFTEEGLIDLKVNLVQASLDKFQEWSLLDLDAKGGINASGSMKGKLLTKAPYFQGEGLFSALVKDFALEDHPVQYISADSVKDVLKGTLAFTHNGGVEETTLKLADGDYTYHGHTHVLFEPTIKLTSDKLYFSALTPQGQTTLNLQGYAQWPSMNRGVLTFCTQFNPHAKYPLTIDWRSDDQLGWRIEKIRGELLGFKADLHAYPSSNPKANWSILSGQMAFDTNQIEPLIPQEWVQKIKSLDIYSAMALDGLFWINPMFDTHLLDSIYFQGQAVTHEVTFKGLICQDVTAQLDYQPGRIELTDLQLDDPAGHISANQMIFMRQDEAQEWFLLMPHMAAKNIKIGLLRSPDGYRFNSPRFRSLVLKRLEIADFHGKLEDITTWRADGSFQFSNSSRKNLSNPLLAIPGEIILRLGLNPQVLNPVTGTIAFNWVGERFYLTKLKDVYSEGRGSKFYLANSPSPSWMDMDGNISILIGMKQYNLIFKIAELFSVSVQGSLKKPEYHLQKLSKYK